MICFPNAKINLGLHVTGKRADGYHDIETVYYPIPLRDALEVVGAESFSFHLSGIAVDVSEEDNLAVRALRLLSDRYMLPPLAVHLFKSIPPGAGLGGGSADAAFMLKLLNAYGRLGLTEGQLEEQASLLGSDCPFFIRNVPVFASGTGNIFEPVSLSLKGYYLCLAFPGVAVSTSAAYAAVTARTPARSLREVVRLPVKEWREAMVNDFEENVCKVYPAIAEAKERLYRAGAVYAAMSGSGSAVFGLFNNPPQCPEYICLSL